MNATFTAFVKIFIMLTIETHRNIYVTFIIYEQREHHKKKVSI